MLRGFPLCLAGNALCTRDQRDFSQCLGGLSYQYFWPLLRHYVSQEMQKSSVGLVSFEAVFGLPSPLFACLLSALLDFI